MNDENKSRDSNKNYRMVFEGTSGWLYSSGPAMTFEECRDAVRFYKKTTGLQAYENYEG